VVIEPPAGNAYCAVDPDGITVIPNGRIIRPHGQTVRIAPHPFGLTLSPDGNTAVTANSGNRPFSITIVNGIGSDRLATRQVPEGPFNDANLLEDVFMGLAITPDNRSVWVAGGQANQIYRFDLANGSKLDSISCVRPGFEDGYLGDLVLSADGNTLYICDQINFRLVIADTRARKVLHDVQVGRYPFGIALSPDGNTVYIANVGVFAYQPLSNVNLGNLRNAGTNFPVSGYNTQKMREGYRQGDVVVPGLGDPNVPESFSVWIIDVSVDTPRVLHKVKTGFLVGEKIEGVPAVGGSSPNSIVTTGRQVFVSNGNNDCISVIDAVEGKVVKNIFLKPLPNLSRLRGVIPFGLALSPDKKRLYVAAAGINAVAVIDVPSLEVIGYLPTGWFPSKVAVTQDGKKLVVANAKGYGSGPNGGGTFQEGPEGSYVGHLMKGSVTVMDIPTDSELPTLTKQVLDNNFRLLSGNNTSFAHRRDNPIPLFPGQRSSPIKHIVFISKENRTYDDVFGQVSAGKGDPALARYGYNRSFSNRAKTANVEGATVMPNHLALAQRFGIADNFYVDSDHSADGHRWLSNTYPNEWVETNVAAGYGGHRRVKPESKAPGRFAWTGAAGAFFPEDYNEAGSMWEHFDRNRISVYNWGFGTEMASNFSDSTMKYYGQKVLINYPVPAPLLTNTSRMYPTYNMAIPDQFRADVFLREFEEKWLSGKEKLPQMLTILLPNDHGAGERPEAGYPFRESYMADNDLALGRIIEMLSATPYWKEMAIFITEDDSQDGQDHVDAHRSVLMVCSPWAKRGFVSHQHYSFGSIFKTFWNILGVPYLNQYDAAAADLSDFFTSKPDFSPYKAHPVDPRVFDPQKALTPFDERFDWKSLLESPQLDRVEDFIREKRKEWNGGNQ
jgi:DNA-binding beta-propeller fold protein YncE